MKAADSLRRLLRPSLSRRLLLALVLAFVLVAVVLLANEYRSFRHSGQQAALLKAGRYLTDALGQAPDAPGAQLIVRVAESYFNRARRDFSQEHGRTLEPMLLQLQAADGRVLYASAALQSRPLPGVVDQVIAHEVDGHAYWLVRMASPHGELSIAEPVLTDATVLGWMGADLLPSLALAFPFVLVPVWWAVRQGLRPLGGWPRSCGSGRPMIFRRSPNTSGTRSCGRWPMPSMPCCCGCGTRCSASAPSCRTPPTSCARRWPSSPRRPTC